MFLSVVTPAYNEALNLAALHGRLCAALEGLEWEWVVVDDHSADETFAVISRLSERDARVRGVRLARNCGSHTAILCGLEHSDGETAVVLAADLQDPPEMLPALVSRWREGAQVVWAVREEMRPSSWFYGFVLRRLAGITSFPPAGVSFFLLDREVVNAVRRCGEQHTSVFALIAWMGFRQASELCPRGERQFGSSGWTLRKKVMLVLDSVTAFTYAPVRMMSYLGFLTAFLGFCYAGFIFWHSLGGRPVEGWASLMVVFLVMGGGQMLMIGVLGEYVWRGLEESRRRPRYLIESRTAVEARVSR